MGWLDGVRTVVGDVAEAASRTVERVGSGRIALAFAKFYPGGLAAFLDRLREAGHGPAVDTWFGSGDRRAVPASAVDACLPDAVADRIAYDLSIPRGRVATALAEFLPSAVAGASESGRLKPQPSYSTQIR